MSSTSKVITYRFTAQVPDDGVLYQITVACCLEAEPSAGVNFSPEQMQQGPVVCIGDACPLGDDMNTKPPVLRTTRPAEFQPDPGQCAALLHPLTPRPGRFQDR